MASDPIPLARPDIGPAERAAINAVLDSGRLSLGPALARFEAALAEAAGVTGAVAVNSGTSALQLALEAAGVGPGDEVITTSLSFVATANAIRRVGARPVFADVEPETLNLDPVAAAAMVGPATRAILVVHLFGHMADMQVFRDLSDARGLVLLEDACEALGSRRAGLRAGGGGLAGVFGFYANKIVTSAEGGAVVSDDSEVLARCRRLRNHGRNAGGEPFDDPTPGFNFRLSELHAALGAAQMERLDALIEARDALAGAYRRRLAGIQGLGLPPRAGPAERVARFTYVVRLPGPPGIRARVSARLTDEGIGNGHYFPAIHRLPAYADPAVVRAGPLPVTEAMADRCLALPFFPGLTEAQIDRVCARLKAAIRAG
jgi:perosamine synthetase